MTARTQIGSVWVVPTQDPYATTLVAPARTIAAGSLVRCFIRGENNDSTIVGTDTALAGWTFIKVRDSNVTGWIGYSWNHPGGTNVVITVTFGTAQGWRSATFVEHTGGDVADPYQSGSLTTSVGSGAMNLSVPFTGDVSIFGGQANYGTTSYTAVTGVILGSTNYHACLIINSTSSSPANPRLTGSSGGVACIAAAFSDPAGGGSTTVDLAAAAIAQATATAALSGGTAPSVVDIEVTGLNFEGAGTATLEQSFTPGIVNMTYVWWERQAPGHNTDAYFGGHQINRADRTFTGGDGIMTVQHNCAGTYNSTTGQRDAGVGSTVFDEIATIGDSGGNGQDRIASHSSYVYAGETQQSFQRVDSVWLPRALSVQMSGTLAIVTFYADCRTAEGLKKVIRQPWETTGSGGVSGDPLAMFIGCVPWGDERYQAKTFGRKTYLRTLTPAEIQTKLYTFSDDTTDPNIHFSNQFPSITGGTTMSDMSGQGNHFTLVDANSPTAFTETVTFTIPASPVVDLDADAAAQAGATASLLKGVSLSAAGLAVAGGSASMSHVVPLAASAVAVAVAGGQLAVAVQLSAGALSTAAASAGLALAVPLSADGAAQAVASADLSTNASVELSADAQASASSSAVLSLTISLSADAVNTALASAALAKSVSLDADSAAQADGAASLQVGAGTDLSADAITQASAGASLWLDVPLGADALAQAVAGGSLSLAVLLRADALAQAGGSAAMAADVQLSADGQVIATAAGALQVLGALAQYQRAQRIKPDRRIWTVRPQQRIWRATAS